MADIKQYEIANLVAPSAKVSGMQKVGNRGAVSAPNYSRPTLGAGGEVTFILDNTDGTSTVNYGIGDGAGLIASKLGALVAADSGTISPAVFNQLSRSRMVIVGMNYGSKVDSSQMSINPELGVAEISGAAVYTPIPTAGSKRNDQQNDKLLTLDFSDSPILLDNYSSIKFPVLAGEKVTVTLFIAATGR